MTSLVAAVLVPLAVIACGGHEQRAHAKLGDRVASAVAAAITAADHARAPWRCAAADGPSAPEATLTTGAATWQVTGHRARRTSGGSDAVIGVIADAGGAAPATVAALGRLRGKLDAAKPDVVLALGGMGRTQAELEGTLGALAAQASWPLIAVPGDLEAMPAQAAAIAALRARGVPVLDGRLIDWIELGDTTIAAIAGAGDASRTVAAADGCTYRPADVAAAMQVLAGRPGMRILATAEAPRAIGADGEPTGTLELVPPPGQPIDVALHGPGDDGAATAPATGGRDGEAVTITPGTADATTRLFAGAASPVHAPTAGVLAVKGNRWTWTPLHDGAGP